jgi:carbon storage regulator CsrA
MLVLSRKSGERVVLTLASGEEIWVGVGHVTTNGKVLLTFQAPDDVDIKREELLARSGHEGQSEGSPGHEAPLATDGP